jgi:hypothetical protein
MAVPEAAIDEDGNFPAWKNEVRFAWQFVTIA